MPNAFTSSTLTTEQLDHLAYLLEKQTVAADHFAQAVAEIADSLGIQAEVLRKYVIAVYKGDKAVSTLKRNTDSLADLLASIKLPSREVD